MINQAQKCPKSQNPHKFSFAALALILLIALFSALAFETIHAGHQEHCHEEGCHICLVLQILHNAKKFSVKTPFLPLKIINFFHINILLFSAAILIRGTLVSQKIKLII
ncbi:MAG: hypothetical protein K5866_03985 [Treponema sp.]|nr:hypothetical protein [Treponema sp.]